MAGDQDYTKNLGLNDIIGCTEFNGSIADVFNNQNPSAMMRKMIEAINNIEKRLSELEATQLDVLDEICPDDQSNT